MSIPPCSQWVITAHWRYDLSFLRMTFLGVMTGIFVTDALYDFRAVSQPKQSLQGKQYIDTY